MLNLVSKITITQNPIDTYPNRSDVVIFDFVNNTEISSTWQNLSDTGSIIFPKNITFRDKFNNISSWAKQNVATNNGNLPPLIVRGDSIKIELGYEYEKTANTFTIELNTIFEGFITSVNNRIPLEFTFEDQMWALKQIQAPNKTFKQSEYTLESMIKELIKDTKYTFKDTINNSPIVTKFGDFTTQNETIAQVLERLQKDFRFEANFRGNELRCGFIVYYPDNRKEHNFKFQHNIISDDLIYKRKDDVKIGVEIHTHQLIALSKTNKDGTTKFKTEKFNYFGYYDKGDLKIVEIDKKPTAFDGEIRTINMMKMPVEEVKNYISRQLNRLTYEGWRGSFVTFGLPKVNHGDIVQLIDDVIPERNGRYMVKSVETSFGVNGFRQTIGLDIKVDDYSQAELNAGL
jgi:hypothetical protein